MTIEVTPTKAFLKDLKRLGDEARQEQVIDAIGLFVENPWASSLNFEKIRSKKGYFSIRASYHDRILLKEVGPAKYDAVAIGNHDYIYGSYFRGR